MKFVSLKAYDGTIVRVEESKIEIFKAQQEKIKLLLNEGKSVEEIKEILKNSNKWFYEYKKMIVI